MKTLQDIVRELRKRDNVCLSYVADYRTCTVQYKELFHDILKTAQVLAEHHIKPKDKVIVWLPNSPTWVTIYFACSVRGVIIVPIDYSARPEFVYHIVRLVKAKAIFMSAFKMIPRMQCEKFFAENFRQLLANVQEIEEWAAVKEQDLCQIVYTSGTTGDPKGVMNTHQNIIANLASLHKIMQLDARTTFLSLLPLSHLFEQTVGLLFPISCGCRIVYISSMKPSALLNTLQKEKIHYMVVVPRILQLLKDRLLEKPVPKVLRRPVIHYLLGFHFKAFICGGAPLDQDLEKFWNNLGYTILQGYGLTEASPILTCNAPAKKRCFSVGMPLPGVHVKIASDHEILAQGRNITKGYYQDPEKTRATIKNGWLHTGDIGYVKDGFLFINGRKKDMIKTSAGINIYPEDIENVLNKNPFVKDSCVVGLKKEKGEIIHAVLVAKKKTNLTRIIDEANKELSESQKITSFSVWPYDDFPRTTTMKIKKNDVKELVEKKTQKQRAMQPSTPRDKISGILQQLSNTSVIKPTSRLGIDLGLSSLDIVQLASMVEAELRVTIDETRLHSKTTVREITTMIQHEQQPPQKVKTFHLYNVFTLLRETIYHVLVFPFIFLLCQPKRTGEKINVRQPAIFIANHVSILDVGVILYCLPFKYRWKYCSAAMTEFFSSPSPLKNFSLKVLYGLAKFFFNAYPFPQEKSIRYGLRNTGQLLDRGCNIILFPEGKRTTTGNLLPFQQGIGLIAREMHAPIVPVYLDGLYHVLPRHRCVPRFGKVTVTFGKPVTFTAESYEEIAKQLETVMRNLKAA